jgi:hypothetical protein
MHKYITDSCVAAAARQAASWPDLVKTIASVAALPIAGLTFWLGFRQKERERTLSYYHKVVVDVVLQKILDGFASEIERINEAGRTAIVGMKSNRKSMPRSCNLALSEFGTNLFTLQDVVVERTIIFDEKTTEEIREDFQQTQDDVTVWFSDVVLHKRRNFEELEQLLRAGQRRIIRRLYQGDFRNF